LGTIYRSGESCLTVKKSRGFWYGELCQLKLILSRKAKSLVVTSRKLVENKSDFLFQHDGAPIHFANSPEAWLKENVPNNWGKCVKPGNSPDLNRIENMLAIFQTLT